MLLLAAFVSTRIANAISIHMNKWDSLPRCMKPVAWAIFNVYVNFTRIQTQILRIMKEVICMSTIFFFFLGTE